MILDLETLIGSISEPDASAYAQGLARQDRLTKPAGALGKLEEVSAWLCAVTRSCPPRPIVAPAVAIFAGDHGVARTAGVSAYPPEVTAQMVANFVAGGAAANVLAKSVGATITIVDVCVDVDWPASGLPVPSQVTARSIRRGSGSIDRADALTRAEAVAGLELGMVVADELIDAGADLLIAGDMGIGNTTAAAVLVGLLTGTPARSVVGRGTGIDERTYQRKLAVVACAMDRADDLVTDGVLADPIGLLARVGGADLGATVGFLLQASKAGIPLLLDGVISAACALVASQIAPNAAGWWLATHTSTEPSARIALGHLGKTPLIDLGMRLGEGTGALMTLPVIRAAGDLLAQMATFTDAGVSDRPEEQDSCDLDDQEWA